MATSMALPPQLPAREPRAFHQRLELRPHDAGVDPAVHRTLGEAAVGAGDDVLAADQAGEPHDPVAHQFGVLDGVGGMADDARPQYFAGRQLDLLPYPPAVLVARVGALH